MRIALPWPSPTLSPNGRADRFRLARAKKDYRAECGWLARKALADHGWPRFALPARLRITFHPPDRRSRDLDNLVASIKAGLDGVADGLKINDADWTFEQAIGEPHPGGQVMIEIVSGLAIPMKGQIA